MLLSPLSTIANDSNTNAREAARRANARTRVTGASSRGSGADEQQEVINRETRIDAVNGQTKEANMMNARTIAICAFGLVLLTHGLDGKGLAQYRNFELKSDLATIYTLAGVPSSEAKMIHQRPAVLQDLDWRPSRWIVGSTSASTDPVEQIVFSFYNNQLFRVVVDYGHERTQGMTDADTTEAISAV